MASTSSRTCTPARARSVSACSNCVPVLVRVEDVVLQVHVVLAQRDLAQQRLQRGAAAGQHAPDSRALDTAMPQAVQISSRVLARPQRHLLVLVAQRRHVALRHQHALLVPALEALAADAAAGRSSGTPGCRAPASGSAA
jgi:hypothetical protein